MQNNSHQEVFIIFNENCKIFVKYYQKGFLTIFSENEWKPKTTSGEIAN